MVATFHSPLFTLLLSYAAICVMQPLIGQTLTHCGLSKSPSHSVQPLALIMYKPFFTLMEAVGHSGSQSPHEVHKSVSIFIAMIILLYQIQVRVKESHLRCSRVKKNRSYP